MAKKKKKKKVANRNSPSKKYEAKDGKKFSTHDAAAAHNKELDKKGGSSKSPSSGSSKAPTVNYTYDSRKETASQYNARIAKEREAVAAYTAKQTKTPAETKAEKVTQAGGLSLEQLLNDSEYKGLPSDQQEVVKAVYMAIGENNAESAGKLVAAFKAAEKLADPYFKQQIRLASDAVERGFVQVDKELEFEEMQASRRLKDLQDDIATRSEYLSIEEQNALKGIEREYKQTIDTTRQNLAATGRSSSSVRAETEQLIEESTGDLRESTKRSFGQQKLDANNQLVRGQRDIQSEVQRLKEVAKQNKTGLFRKAEEQLGTSGLPKLNFDVNPLGGLTGTINEDKTNDIIGAVKNLVF